MSGLIRFIDSLIPVSADSVSEFSAPPRYYFGERNLRLDGGAFSRSGFDVEGAVDHFHPFPHAQQPQSFALFSVQHTLHRKAFAIVLYLHAYNAIQILKRHFRPAGTGM